MSFALRNTRNTGTGQSDTTEPRQVGDLCYSGYWGVPYLVLAISKHPNGSLREITVLNLAEPNELDWYRGQISVKSHCTSWEWGRDLIIDDGLHVGSEMYDTYWSYINELRDIAANWINPRNGRSNNSRF